MNNNNTPWRIIYIHQVKNNLPAIKQPPKTCEPISAMEQLVPSNSNISKI